jgi:hypothetical protein
MRTAALALVLFTLCIGLWAGVACADGDPASDYLYTQKVFVPFDVKASKAKQQELAATVEGVNKSGFKIRVAIIGSAYDLGAVPSLWKKPQTYARFLGAELAFVYKGRLLIVMPNGFGFHKPGHNGAHEQQLLQDVSVPSGPDGLVGAATDAVRTLASDAGVQVTELQPKKSTATRDRIVIVLAAVALIALALVARELLRRRRVA